MRKVLVTETYGSEIGPRWLGIIKESSMIWIIGKFSGTDLKVNILESAVMWFQ